VRRGNVVPRPDPEPIRTRHTLLRHAGLSGAPDHINELKFQQVIPLPAFGAATAINPLQPIRFALNPQNSFIERSSDPGFKIGSPMSLLMPTGHFHDDQ